MQNAKNLLSLNQKYLKMWEPNKYKNVVISQKGAFKNSLVQVIGHHCINYIAEALCLRTLDIEYLLNYMVTHLTVATLAN